MTVERLHSVGGGGGIGESRRRGREAGEPLQATVGGRIKDDDSDG